ncbi:hypothetical protein NM688_g2329 [Phlebia brevispora]|uniref:Uncharacterized protein n=1 Tax=Phlebia brevispora TaxID=194682 RepID=A0ACC1T9L6_9APHY|nr:hypothetical protein NM688_g2329 [Phlebia brevispora]
MGMTYDTMDKDDNVKTAPLFGDINVAFQDMGLKGFVQKDPAFVSYPFGEYSALASIVGVLPISSLVDVIFYRGITTQRTVDADKYAQLPEDGEDHIEKLKGFTVEQQVHVCYPGLPLKNMRSQCFCAGTGVLLLGATMEPPKRLGSEAKAKAWLDSVAAVYTQRPGISLSRRVLQVAPQVLQVDVRHDGLMLSQTVTLQFSMMTLGTIARTSNVIANILDVLSMVNLLISASIAVVEPFISVITAGTTTPLQFACRGMNKSASEFLPPPRKNATAPRTKGKGRIRRPLSHTPDDEAPLTNRHSLEPSEPVHVPQSSSGLGLIPTINPPAGRAASPDGTSTPQSSKSASIQTEQRVVDFATRRRMRPRPRLPSTSSSEEDPPAAKRLRTNPDIGPAQPLAVKLDIQAVVPVAASKLSDHSARQDMQATSSASAGKTALVPAADISESMMSTDHSTIPSALQDTQATSSAGAPVHAPPPAASLPFPGPASVQPDDSLLSDLSAHLNHLHPDQRLQILRVLQDIPQPSHPAASIAAIDGLRAAAVARICREYALVAWCDISKIKVAAVTQRPAGNMDQHTVN